MTLSTVVVLRSSPRYSLWWHGQVRPSELHFDLMTRKFPKSTPLDQLVSRTIHNDHPVALRQGHIYYTVSFRVRKTGGNRSGSPVPSGTAPARYMNRSGSHPKTVLTNSWETVNWSVSPVTRPVFLIRGNWSAAVLLTLVSSSFL
jgi:hypothetical protein